MRNTYLTEKYLDSSDQKYFAWRAGPDRARGLGAGLARSSPALSEKAAKMLPAARGGGR